MHDLIAWLRDVLDQDAARITEPTFCGPVWPTTSDLLARIAADREILVDYKRLLFDDPFRRTDYFRGQRDALEYVVRHKAEVYADRPGYREEWRP